MNFQEIKSELENQGFTNSDFAYELPNPVPNIGKQTTIEDVGGEGEGEHRHIVKYFEDHDIYIRLDGYYTSYEGTDWSGYSLYEVTPQQKVITVYE